MELKKIQRKERKDVGVTLRITKNTSEWLKEMNISPQRLFDEAVKELQEGIKESKEGREIENENE